MGVLKKMCDKERSAMERTVFSAPPSLPHATKQLFLNQPKLVSHHRSPLRRLSLQDSSHYDRHLSLWYPPILSHPQNSL